MLAATRQKSYIAPNCSDTSSHLFFWTMVRVNGLVGLNQLLPDIAAVLKDVVSKLTGSGWLSSKHEHWTPRQFSNSQSDILHILGISEIHHPRGIVRIIGANSIAVDFRKSLQKSHSLRWTKVLKQVAEFSRLT